REAGQQPPVDRRCRGAGEEDRRRGAVHLARRASARRAQRGRGARGRRRAGRGEARLAAQRLLQGNLRRPAADRQLRGRGQGALALMRWLAVALLLVVAGCGGGKATVNNSNTSLAQSRLTQAETRAAGFSKSGDYENAARQYAEALRIATTLEN